MQQSVEIRRSYREFLHMIKNLLNTEIFAAAACIIRKAIYFARLKNKKCMLPTVVPCKLQSYVKQLLTCYITILRREHRNRNPQIIFISIFKFHEIRTPVPDRCNAAKNNRDVSALVIIWFSR